MPQRPSSRGRITNQSLVAGLPGVQVDRSGSSLLTQAAESLSNFGHQFADIADQQAISRAQLQAKSDAARGAGSIRDDFRVSSRAYNQTLRVQTASNLLDGYRAKLAQFEAEFPDDLTKFGSAADAALEGLKQEVGRVDPSIMDEIKSRVELARAGATARVTSRWNETATKEVTRGVDRILKNAGDHIRNIPINDPTWTLEFLALDEQLRGVLMDAADPSGNKIFTELQVTEMIAGVEKQAVLDGMQLAIARETDTDFLNELAARLRANEFPVELISDNGETLGDIDIANMFDGLGVNQQLARLAEQQVAHLESEGRILDTEAIKAAQLWERNWRAGNMLGDILDDATGEAVHGDRWPVHKQRFQFEQAEAQLENIGYTAPMASSAARADGLEDFEKAALLKGMDRQREQLAKNPAEYFANIDDVFAGTAANLALAIETGMPEAPELWEEYKARLHEVAVSRGVSFQGKEALHPDLKKLVAEKLGNLDVPADQLPGQYGAAQIQQMAAVFGDDFNQVIKEAMPDENGFFLQAINDFGRIAPVAASELINARYTERDLNEVAQKMGYSESGFRDLFAEDSYAQGIAATFLSPSEQAGFIKVLETFTKINMSRGVDEEAAYKRASQVLRGMYTRYANADLSATGSLRIPTPVVEQFPKAAKLAQEPALLRRYTAHIAPNIDTEFMNIIGAALPDEETEGFMELLINNAAWTTQDDEGLKLVWRPSGTAIMIKTEQGDLIQAGLSWQEIESMGDFIDEELVPSFDTRVTTTVGSSFPFIPRTVVRRSR